MITVPKLTTAAACRVARLNRDRFNEHVAAGAFPCAPNTVPGRARLFDPDDMIALCLFRDGLDDGLDAHHAGEIACAVANVARQHPDARAISYVQTYFGDHGYAFPADQVADASTWDSASSFISGTDIRKATIFRVGKLRDMIAHYTESERAVIGEND